VQEGDVLSQQTLSGCGFPIVTVAQSLSIFYLRYQAFNENADASEKTNDGGQRQDNENDRDIELKHRRHSAPF
jgi:hypothetical protein